jgi:ribosomal protein S12
MAYKMPTINQLIASRAKRRSTRNKVPALQAVAAEARRLHARLHDDPEEAELGAS